MVLARSCALTAVSLFLAQGLNRKAHTVRQHLREFCSEAQAKRGKPRQEGQGESGFAPLVAWGLSGWEGNQLALAVDAPTFGQRVVVLGVSGVYRGRAIPIAWTVLPAVDRHAWRGEWLRLLRQVRTVVPRRFFVLVRAARGWQARWLLQHLVRLGGHPLLRSNTGGTVRPAQSAHYPPLREFGPQPGTPGVGTGTAFQGPRRRLNCPLLARWAEGYRDPWLLLTALAPSAGKACWQGLRTWIEQGFKVTKRGGWPWQRTRMSAPQRAARLWVAVAVATVWVRSVGGLAAASLPVSTLLPRAAADCPASRPRQATRLRLVSIFRPGWITILVALLNQRHLPRGRFVPEPWPQPDHRNPLRGTPEMLLAA